MSHGNKDHLTNDISNTALSTKNSRGANININTSRGANINKNTSRVEREKKKSQDSQKYKSSQNLIKANNAHTILNTIGKMATHLKKTKTNVTTKK